MSAAPVPPDGEPPFTIADIEAGGAANGSSVSDQSPEQEETRDG